MIVNYNYLFDNDDYYVDFDYGNDYDDDDAMLAFISGHWAVPALNKDTCGSPGHY